MEDDRGGGIGPWADWARLIVSGLEAQAERDKQIEKLAQENRLEIAKLRVEFKQKSGFFGFLGSMFTVLIFIAYEILKKVMK